MVYASEGLRGTLAPQVPHIPLWIVMGALVLLDLLLLALGMKKFQKKAVS
jgi:hypothetical protein